MPGSRSNWSISRAKGRVKPLRARWQLAEI